MTESETEEWRVIPSAPDYAASSLGRIRRETDSRAYKRGLIRKQHPHPWGYLLVGIVSGGRRRTAKVHQLVCEAFHGPRPPHCVHVAHADGSRDNNRPENLRWATRQENAADTKLHGRAFVARGTANANAKLTEEAVAEIRAAIRRKGLLRELAVKHGISRNVVGNLRTRGNGAWPHVPFPD